MLQTPPNRKKIAVRAMLPTLLLCALAILYEHAKWEPQSTKQQELSKKDVAQLGLRLQGALQTYGLTDLRVESGIAFGPRSLTLPPGVMYKISVKNERGGCPLLMATFSPTNNKDCPWTMCITQPLSKQSPQVKQAVSGFVCGKTMVLYDPDTGSFTVRTDNSVQGIRKSSGLAL